MRRKQRTEPEAALLEIARDLTASLAAEDRYDRLIAAIRRAVPADAVCLLRLEGEDLVPLVAHGLSEEAVVRRYARREHPRLDIILGSDSPVRFPPDSGLPDPFDGMLVSDPGALRHIHACLGCALVEGGEVVGALTADALEPRAFDHLDERFLATLGALAGAAVRTTTLIERLEKTAERRDAVARELQRTAGQLGGEILGQSPAVRRMLQTVDLVARSDLPVLITGETGVGKELVARRIHAGSSRREEPLIQVNCAALPESIAESELFGHVAGAFTGAGKDRAGKFEVADGGTFILDEVGELSPSLQAKLLRALQNGEIQRIGSDRLHQVDVRVIAATNRDLEAEVEAGRFRRDLYHRLAGYPVRVPALRERREDIPLLAAHFLDHARRRLGLGPLRLTEDAKIQLMEADWPGNIRELENVIGRAALRAAGTASGDGAGDGAAETTGRGVPLRIGPELLDLHKSKTAAGHVRAGGQPDATLQNHGEAARHRLPSAAPRPLRERVREFERRLIIEAVERNDGNWAAAARELGMHRSNLHHLARRLGLRET